MPDAAQGRLTFLGQEIPIRVEDVASDACQPGTRVRLYLVWEDEDLRASTCDARGAEGLLNGEQGSSEGMDPWSRPGRDLRPRYGVGQGL